MADQFNPLKDFSPQSDSTKPTAKPIGFMERIILNNLFDTQPKRREAYLKRLGYEMDPRDDNKYRPIGSSSGYAEIDPGIGDEYKKGGLAAAGKEILKDIGDVGFDAIIAGPMTAGGAAAGSPLSIPGLILGGAAGNAVAEDVKKMVGDLLLDQDIPLDQQSVLLQSVFSGIAPAFVKGGKTIAKEGYAAYLNQRKNAIINAAKQSGGGLDEQILDKAIKNPEMFTREAVTGATDKLKGIYKNIFGIEDPLKLGTPDSIRGGAFGNAIKPLNDAANVEIEKLAIDPKANVSFDELANPIKNLIHNQNGTGLADKFDLSNDEKEALSYLKENLQDLIQKTKPSKSTLVDASGNKISGPSRDLNFKEARDWLKARQSEISAKDTAGNYLNPAGRVLAPAFGGGEGVLSILNKKAAEAGSSLPEINAKRARILQAYNTAQSAFTPQNITSAFVGTDNVKKQLIQDASQEIDSVLGTQFSKSIEDGAMQRIVENLYTNPKGFGAVADRSQIVGSGIQGLARGGVSGGLGSAIGAAKGSFDAAKLATPESALNELRSTSSRLSDITSDLATPQTLSAPATLISQEAGREIGQAVTPKPTPEKPFDPLEDFDPLKDFNK